jgi:hypothetical protein
MRSSTSRPAISCIRGSGLTTAGLKQIAEQLDLQEVLKLIVAKAVELA